RVAALRTLIGLLAGGVDGAADALVDAAIVQSYRATGRSGDEDAPHGRTPALADVVMHLDAHAETRALAARLARYTTGSSAWLFRRDAPRISAEGESVVFSLAGLPEEERTAAMFLVLDAVWSRIADAARPTLIVVDEAWWLMRSPETARYLVRIVKTARKRRAGLTLLTQDTDDVLAHADGRALVTNAALQILLRAAPQSLPALSELFRLTHAEQQFLLTAGRGDALLVAGAHRVPLHVVASDAERALIERRS
ncbi:MAG TPA: hypothetical protein VEU77_08160, partial [Candidatus Acidoferrales bacterium]|nr:hypothetical protein [Candidatus Acidoferrales bacterium]